MGRPERKSKEVTPEDFFELRDWVLVCLVPHAVDHGLISESEAIWICLDGCPNDDSAAPRSMGPLGEEALDRLDEIQQRIDESPRGCALALLLTTIFSMLSLELVFEQSCSECIELEVRWVEDFLAFEANVITLEGYMLALNALKEANVQRSESGAEKRRQIGDASRERLLAEAQKYRGKMARERAAPRIGDAIGMSPSRVRKLLSEHFPGDAWNKPD